MPSQVVLVNQDDARQGTARKLRAHREGLLHRAISVFVFDAGGRLLVHKRSGGKYHSGGLWSNTCCSHPRPDEEPIAAARRRLREEMGFSCSLSPAFHFTYRAEVGPGLTEHEYDHVFVGQIEDVDVSPDPTEVSDWAWVDRRALRTDIAAHPERYTVWFRSLLPSFLEGVPAEGPEVRPSQISSPFQS